MENLNERLKQAKLDKASVEENIKDLEKQIEEAKTPKPRHGDIFWSENDHKLRLLMLCVEKYGDWRVFGNIRGGKDWTTKKVEQNYRDQVWTVRGNIFDGDKWNG